ncbi:MAG: GGDEF domain-containing protein [Candidatus Eremiobacteraeota bacterium]|nr:GGDEF domain-containing protein [Candidatus Eremiobacteraeota bacterium]MBV8433848.1 GGDEF domain-containing protein [Candidatus Eremiobacteraeota bacterium]MBV8721808.1 GGDEF domain-containing protein [Candidatus Eremiobacteraeota bacterium]
MKTELSGQGPTGVDVGALQAELDELRARLAMVEAERDEYAQQNAELFVLQQVFSTINSTLEINDILSMVLRGVVEALKFKRVILFDVIENGVIIRRLEGDLNGQVLHALDPREYRSDSTLQDVAHGDLQLAYGSATDPDKPLEDTRGAYCIAPLVARDIVRGMLYADDPPGEEITENQLRVVLDFASQAAIAVENARLYDETRRLLEETQRLAHTDSLTGIPNRRALHDLLERELHTSERYDTPFAFVILDLDDLKKINDSGGHSLGDLALKRFAQVLKKNARKGDIIARYAGDEFVVVMAQSDREQAKRGVERIMAALRRNGLASSIGVAMFPTDGTDGQTLFFSADEALYQAKQAGKNAYRFYDRSIAGKSSHGDASA